MTKEHGDGISIYELVYWIFMEALSEHKFAQSGKVVHLVPAVRSAIADRVSSVQKVPVHTSYLSFTHSLNQPSAFSPCFDTAVVWSSHLWPAPETMNQAIMISVEECGKEHFQKNGKPYYLIKGWYR